MEKLLRPYDKEYMRMEMLKHEETFKEQVYELHRIYRIQKTLMESIESSRSNGSFSLKYNHHANTHQSSRTRLDLERPADQEYNIAESDNRMLEVMDESEIELTLGPASISSSSTESSHMNKTSSSRAKQKTEFSGRELGLLQVTDMTMAYQNGRKTSIDLEEQLRQGRLKQPPWVFQVVSMKMT